ncbi:hypothetical protein OESDEN_17652 [Oesophagostomum dentatum]|uniref:Uncharacterized protein n=1 Tax=Oesophagostomum dentatum TaxID=61180 RepID=A0A0B1SCN0_OESDE|nr:hypothetical protein OESDEN_17652 [Oesophagostomum dentatum]
MTTALLAHARIRKMTQLHRVYFDGQNELFRRSVTFRQMMRLIHFLAASAAIP